MRWTILQVLAMNQPEHLTWEPRLPVQYPKVNCDGLETVPVATLGDALAAVANLRSHGTVRRRPALRSVPGEA